MKKFLLPILLLMIGLTARAQFPGWSWANSYGGGGGVTQSYVTATDALGNVVVSGSFTSPSITFGSTTLTNAGGQDIYVVKLSPAGTVIWASAIAGTGLESPRGLEIDAAGDIYLGALCSSPTIMVGSNSFSNPGVILVKFDPSGNITWASAAPGTTLTDIAVDGSGSLYIGGVFSTATLTLGSVTVNNSGAGSDLFVVKYSPTGTPLWGIAAGTPTGGDWVRSMAIDPAGNLLISGDFHGTSISFGSFTLTNTSSMSHYYLAKYSPAGTALWATGTSAGGATAESVVTDVAGNIFVAGMFYGGPISFGSFTITGNPNVWQLFIAKYSPQGTPLWVQGHSSSYLISQPDLAVDPAGDIYFTGPFVDTITLGTNTYVSVSNVTTGSDFYVGKYSSGGIMQWSAVVGSTAGDIARDIAVDPNGGVYITGVFGSPSLSFGPTTLTNSNGMLNMFIAKVGSCSAQAPSQPGAISGLANVCQGSTQTYSVLPVTGATSYSWTIPTGWTGSSTTNSITVTAGSSGGTISVTALNGCANSAPQTLAVSLATGTGATITAMGSTSFCQGGSVVLNANTGSGFTYQWKLNGNDITGATASSYTAASAGNYSVVVTAGGCSSTSAVSTVAVYPNPSPTITLAGFKLSTSAGQGTYQWYENGVAIPGATTNSYTVTQNASYYVVVTNSNNCSGQSNTIAVTNVKVKGPKKKELNVYPSYGDGRYTIDLPDGSMPLFFRLYNTEGAKVQQQTISTHSGRLIFEIMNKFSGMYIVELLYEDASYIQKIFIK